MSKLVIFMATKTTLKKNTPKKKYVSSSRERELTAYPKSRQFRLFIAWCSKEKLKKSKALCLIIQEKFDNMDSKQQAQLLYNYDNLTEDQRKFTHKDFDL